MAACPAPRPTCFVAPKGARGEMLSAEQFAQRYLAPARKAGAPTGWVPAVVPGQP